jgi:hypothetical protein
MKGKNCIFVIEGVHLRCMRKDFTTETFSFNFLIAKSSALCKKTDGSFVLVASKQWYHLFFF